MCGFCYALMLCYKKFYPSARLFWSEVLFMRHFQEVLSDGFVCGFYYTDIIIRILFRDAIILAPCGDFFRCCAVLEGKLYFAAANLGLSLDQCVCGSFDGWIRSK